MGDSRVDSSGLLGIGDSDFEEVALSDGLAWLRQRIGKFVKGGIYLLAGQPGIGKSTLGIQLAVDIAQLRLAFARCGTTTAKDSAIWMKPFMRWSTTGYCLQAMDEMARSA